MATQERDELLEIVRRLTEEDLHDLLVFARSLEPRQHPAAPMPWVGILHEAPDFALRAKDTLRTELGGQ